jgi:LuxR family maltose regulon positive regulatory protein
MEPLVGRALDYRLRYLLDSRTLAQTEPASPSGSLAARMLLVQGKPEAALELAAETLEDPYAAGGPVSAVESRLVSAMALTELSRADEAVEQLSVAVEVAEPDGITRLFLEFGPAIEGMLRDVATRDRGTAPYAQRLLVALRDGGPSASDGIETSDDGLIEPLNGRETELLELLAARRSNHEIADEMFISVNTVKWHARNLYGKLGVSGRAEAVVRGRELGLI